ncbi:MAG: winged helix-turn-helix transcriptional regulator [Promethearchaeota archaeon]
MESIKPPRKLRYLLSLECILIICFLLIVFSSIYFISAGPEPTFDTEETYRFLRLVILSVIVFLIGIFAVLSIKEYKEYIVRRTYILNGITNLSLRQIFDNENRLRIVKEILNNPGIHQNELRRNCYLQKGQLQWHLDVLLKNSVIKKEKFGQYTIYFPITSSIKSIEDFKNLLPKSETTENVLEIIQKNPGINSSKISKMLNLSRNTIKYHVDKLFENKKIYLKQKGRKIELYLNI